MCRNSSVSGIQPPRIAVPGWDVVSAWAYIFPCMAWVLVWELALLLELG